MNISISQLEQLKHYHLFDIRDHSLFANGAIPHAQNVDPKQFFAEYSTPRPNTALVFYCQRGDESKDIVSQLREKGYDAYTLTGGYLAWLMAQFSEDKSEDIAHSIRKKFHKSIFSQFTKAIKTYDLIQDGDHIAVCISGGKDSMLMAKLFQELTRHKKTSFQLSFLVMDPGYAPENRALIERNAKEMGVPITMFETDIFTQVFTAPKNACYLCARMRRGHLYSKARELGCNKIALGHHFDDVIETNLMGMLYGAQIQTMMPKLHSTNFDGLELIRPMYLIREADIKHFRDYHKLHFLQCACRFTDTCSIDGSMVSKRTEIKKLIQSLKETNPNVEHTIFRSMENIHLDAVLAYKKDGKKHWFLEGYS